MSKSKIRWAAIQPLTGMAYTGTESIIGHPAEFILSYPGLDSVVYKKDGTVNYMWNEHHLLEYLKKKNALPQYLHFNREMFDNEDNIDAIEFLDTDYSKPKWNKDKIYTSDLDLVIAVPVCSGLSGANTVDHGKEDSVKNSNMRFITRFTLQKLQPKAFIFENAPGLFTSKGTAVRNYLNQIAQDNSYSITYVKTDTHLHDNVQQRMRTFVIFWKQLNGVAIPPIINGEQKPVNDVVEYLNRIPKNATQNDDKHLSNYFIPENMFEYNFLKSKYGNKWREKVGRCRFKGFIVYNKLVDEFIKFANDEKITKQYQHCVDKKAIGKGYFDRSHFICPKDHMPTIYHGNTWSMIHPIEDRHFTFREIMHCMGAPEDFEFLDSYRSFGSIIGQNVPGRTIAHWVKEIKTILDNWDAKRNIHPNGSQTSNIYFYNNIYPKNSFYEIDKHQLQFGKYNV
jgi:site-specific DNA-cytosine methylase